MWHVTRICKDTDPWVVVDMLRAYALHGVVVGAWHACVNVHYMRVLYVHYMRVLYVPDMRVFCVAKRERWLTGCRLHAMHHSANLQLPTQSAGHAPI